MEEAVARGRKRADALFAYPGTPGSETGCGQVFLLLGDPLEVEGREVREQFSSIEPMREGARRPERWIYRSRRGDPIEFTGGELQISFDAECRFSEAGRVLDDLHRVARSRITQPALDYRRTAEGRLMRLEDARGGGGGPAADAASLLASGRSDFPLEVEPKLLLRTQSGHCYAAGLVRGRPMAPGPQAGDQPAPASGTVVAQAVPDSGPALPAVQRPFASRAEEDGSFLASYGLTLTPGRYTLKVGLLLPGGQGSTTSLALEVPDFDAPGLKTTDLVLYPEQDAPASADPKDPYAALAVGSLRLRPRFGNVFRAGDAIQVVAVLYGGRVDAGSGKASLRARFSILEADKPVARGGEQSFETPMAVASVGPLALRGYAPGPYIVRLEARDEVAGATVTREAALQILE
jgi:hypothetical protein